MSEEPKSIWRRSWRGPWSLLLAWLVVMAVPFMIFLMLMAPMNMLRGSRDEFGLLGVIEILATVVLILGLLIRWVCCWKNFRRLLFGSACFATLLGLFYAEEDWRGWHNWDQFKQEWAAKGEKFDMAGVTPPPVPAEQNFALAPIWVESMKAQLGPDRSPTWFGEPYAENGRTNFVNRLALSLNRPDNCAFRNAPTNGDWAQGTFTDLKAWQTYYRLPVETNRDYPVITNEFPVVAQPQSPAADVLLALSRYNAAIADLRAASSRQYSRFPLNYDSESPAAILLPHLAALKQSSQVLALRAIAEMQNSQTGQALADIKLSLYLINACRSEPFMISQLVRLAILQIALQPVWEGCARHVWSDEQLVALETELAKLDFPADYQAGIRGEMALEDVETLRLRRHPGELNYIAGDDAENINLPGAPIANLIPAGWFYQNMFHCNRLILEDYLPVADAARGTVSPGLARRSEQAYKSELKSAPPYTVLDRLVLPWLNKTAIKFACGQASVNLARTALALERYRLAHGEYPETLDALAPQFIAQLPHDVINGQPLKYRRESDGRFVLYSVGWNETDDGGTVTFASDHSTEFDLEQGDWVWKYPTKTK